MKTLLLDNEQTSEPKMVQLGGSESSEGPEGLVKTQASGPTAGVPDSEVLRRCTSTTLPGGGYEAAGPGTPL